MNCNENPSKKEGEEKMTDETTPGRTNFFQMIGAIMSDKVKNSYRNFVNNITESYERIDSGRETIFRKIYNSKNDAGDSTYTNEMKDIVRSRMKILASGHPDYNDIDAMRSLKVREIQLNLQQDREQGKTDVMKHLLLQYK